MNSPGRAARAKAGEGGKRTRRRFAWVAVWVGLVGLVVVLSLKGERLGFWSRGVYFVVGRGLLDVRWITPTPGADTFRALGVDLKASDWVLPRWEGDRTEGLVRVPAWMVFCLTGVLGGMGVWRNRASEGFCARCGYELSGLAANDGVVTCPECGEKNVTATALSREVRTARGQGAWSIGVGVAMTGVIIVVCARRWNWSRMGAGPSYSSTEFERGALVYSRWSPTSSEFAGDGATSQLEWWRVMLPRLEWGSSDRHVRVPLWPIPAALIGWGWVRRSRVCRRAAK